MLEQLDQGNFSSLVKRETKLSFPMLRILELSHNQFTGVLPTRYFEKFNMMHWGCHKGELNYIGPVIHREDFMAEAYF